MSRVRLPFLLLLIIIILTSFSTVRGQEERDFNQQIWFDINPKWVSGTGKIIAYGSMGYRTIFPAHWNRYAFNAGIGYIPFLNRSGAGTALRYLQFHAGIWDYYTHTLKNINLNEIRLYQGVKVQWPTLHRVHLIHYGRVEERFEHVQNSETSDFTLRLRYRLTAEFQFTRAVISKLYIPVSAEIFISAGEGLYFNELIQVSPGIGYNFTDRFSTVFQFYYNLSRNSGTDSFQNNALIYRLRFFYTF